MDASGPLAGARGDIVRNDDELLKSAILLAAQVGFAATEDGPFRWFELHELPERSALHAHGFVPGHRVHARIVGATAEVAWAALGAKGFERRAHIGESPLPTRVNLRVESGIADVHLRAFAKIAFNCAAKVYGAAFVLHPEFNEARRFIRNGIEPPTPITHIGPNDVEVAHGTNGPAMQGHYLHVKFNCRAVVAEVSLFQLARCTVRLAEPGLLTERPASARLFDLEARVVRAIPLRPGT